MFEIILLEKVRGLGDLGQSVKVANGYARNFLIPQKKAVPATAEAKAQVEARRRQLAQEESKRREVAQARADLAVREITVTRLARETGDLYGSVSPADIAEALEAAGARIEKSEILQPEGPFKSTGQFEAEVILHPEVRFTVQVNVQGGESNAPGAVEGDGDGDGDAADATVESSVADDTVTDATVTADAPADSAPDPEADVTVESSVADTVTADDPAKAGAAESRA